MNVERVIVAVIVIALIIFISWWFFGKHQEQVQTAKQTKQAQSAVIKVHGGYSPATVVLKQGVPGQVKFEMHDQTACLSHVVFEQLGVDKDLTKQEVTTIDIPTDQPQTFNFACGMGMFHGKVIVK
ncbi:MAG: cupredoxin domain-containing protein [Lactobacillus sp.]|jgi:plastocyanin domain-containing protein|nr:cupredoxin domain-containing protein [Lactobacillus sp.]MCH3906550.1 cupredoxin domain-containing protein [Lactobacillus sp.]MCH3989815.1 cupredoxin domain-containing protein [Lactobacillus sp.]MCH4068019.1 cupredoxin domain-containing protein [Lactobacillus sp.]MCI1304025.1 cupredoxin domain-containing protein [Lactobacillus sp.]